MKDWIVGV